MIRGFRQLLSKKWLISSKSTKNRRFGQNFQLFDADYHVSAFWWTFQQKVTKSASFSKKSRKMVDLAKNFHFFKQNTMFYAFGEFFSKNLQKVPHFVKKTQKIVNLAKSFQLFDQTTMFRPFDELFGKKLQKVPHLVKKHEKWSIWPKTLIFSSKIPCFKVLLNFSENSCKKCLISRKSTKNRRFGQKLPNFRTNYHLRSFWWTFQQKVPHLVRKDENSSIWPKTSKFSNKLPCFGVWTKYSAKSCKTSLISWKSTKNRRFGQKLATFRPNYHVSTFWRAF